MNMNPLSDQTVRLGVLGLGYVGLPLAVAFSKHVHVVGFDISQRRVSDLNRGVDETLEVSSEDLKGLSGIQISSDPNDLRDCNVLIVTVPTPIDIHKQPDLSALMEASRIAGSVISSGSVVIYESTVYPGATEEECVPVIELASGLKLNQDFYVGYSPERANPGDPAHKLADIVKVTSGSTPEAAAFVDGLYAMVVAAGTFMASSIRVAEAAKVIENTQRDLNIALINEFALIFRRLDLDTAEVLAAAATKWNFLNFRPGLVGGHCIGVDPYYLTHKAEAVGYRPEVILAGRRINDFMGGYVARELVKEMIRRGTPIEGSRILVMGLAFKENCPDLRNSRVVDIIDELKGYGAQVDVWDPWIAPIDARREYDIEPITNPQTGVYDGIVVAVAHSQFEQLGAEGIRALGTSNLVLFDVKSALPRGAAELRL